MADDDWILKRIVGLIKFMMPDENREIIAQIVKENKQQFLDIDSKNSKNSRINPGRTVFNRDGLAAMAVAEYKRIKELSSAPAAGGKRNRKTRRNRRNKKRNTRRFK